MILHDMPPKERTIIPPSGGWKEHTCYSVLISWRVTNPVHRAIFYTGFLNNGQPAAYNQVWNPSYDLEQHTIGRAHYMAVEAELLIDFKE